MTITDETDEKDQNVNSRLDELIQKQQEDQASSLGGVAAAAERGVDVGRVGAWATDFEKLLADPVGLQTFTVSFKLVV